MAPASHDLGTHPLGGRSEVWRGSRPPHVSRQASRPSTSQHPSPTTVLPTATEYPASPGQKLDKRFEDLSVPD